MAHSQALVLAAGPWVNRWRLGVSVVTPLTVAGSRFQPEPNARSLIICGRPSMCWILCLELEVTP